MKSKLLPLITLVLTSSLSAYALPKVERPLVCDSNEHTLNITATNNEDTLSIQLGNKKTKTQGKKIFLGRNRYDTTSFDSAASRWNYKVTFLSPDRVKLAIFESRASFGTDPWEDDDSEEIFNCR